jgi:cholesterol transport system auxiliary component
MHAFCISMFVSLLAGCGVGHTPVTRYYKLNIPPAPAPAGPSAPASLRIEPFRTATILRQDRIVYRPSPVEVGFYEYHRWAEPPNDSVTNALADQLTKRRVFQSVAISDGDDKSDYVLKGTVDRLQEVDYMGGVRVQVTISLELEDPSQQQTIWSGAASSECAVKQSDVPAVVAAMGQASEQSIYRLMTDVTKFVQSTRLTSSTTTRSTPR